MLQCIINREVVFDGTAKVAHFLDQDERAFERFKKQEVAYMLNLQPETLSRILRKLSRDGIIDTEGTGVAILDREQLRAIYL